MKSSKSIKWRLAQWLEIRWWQQYLQSKEKHSYYQQKAAYWQRNLKALSLNLPPQQSITEVGCGPAGIFITLSEHQVRAIDPLLKQYEQKLAHFSTADYPWVQFESIPIEEAAGPETDWVFCFNAINHIDDWSRGLDQLDHLCTEEGTIILGSDVHKHRLLKWLFRWIPGDALHPQQHDRQDYLDAMAKRGWIIKKESILKKGLIFDYWIASFKKNTVA